MTSGAGDGDMPGGPKDIADEEREYLMIFGHGSSLVIWDQKWSGMKYL